MEASQAMEQASMLRQYLSFGFVPDPEIASEYLHEMLSGPVPPEADPSKLLIEIVADLTAGAREVVIPLSGGRDSRAMLGAALHAFPKGKIHCITFGSEGSEDVEGARIACRAARVSHQLINPDTLAWNLEELTDQMERRLADRAGIPPIDGMLVFGKLAELIAPEVPVLSGYLGIVAVGKHLGVGALENDDDVLARFLAQNRAVVDDRSSHPFREFLEFHEPMRRNWPGLAKFDLLDLGFRQRLRIRSSVTGSFRKPVRPYEDRRWAGHWYSKPVAERINYPRYDGLLAEAFPVIFGRQPIFSRVRRWRARRRGRGVYRGDPRQNPSMAAALEDACRSIGERDPSLGGSAMAAFTRLMQEPSLTSFRTVRWFATAEILARAQERVSAA